MRPLSCGLCRRASAATAMLTLTTPTTAITSQGTPASEELLLPVSSGDSAPRLPPSPASGAGAVGKWWGEVGELVEGTDSGEGGSSAEGKQWGRRRLVNGGHGLEGGGVHAQWGAALEVLGKEALEVLGKEVGSGVGAQQSW
ncbi:hypothetical protein CYMTET_45729 [Cymbomonas tetramitiformis]|uniref:Uncharacterized protein n=1 Tax=Cymbomonas tetramitiformis TaxID=36881 RepID=A0AAE0EYB7_9CHLO|nr:hypothetical protein CYMTET_45729 [Cymbomonas tetramitiformis]